MQEFALVVDGVVAVLIIVSAYLAMVRGLTRELFALASWLIAFVAAFYFTPQVKDMLPGVPGLGAVLSSCEVLLLVAFVLVFGVSLIVTGVIFMLVSGPPTNSGVGRIDQGLGFVYGALRGLVLVAVLYIVYEQAVQGSSEYAFVRDAYTIQFVSEAARALEAALPTEMPAWIEDRIISITSECQGG